MPRRFSNSEKGHMGALQNEPKKADLRLTAVLYALSDDTRLQIVQSLANTSGDRLQLFRHSYAEI